MKRIWLMFAAISFILSILVMSPVVFANEMSDANAAPGKIPGTYVPKGIPSSGTPVPKELLAPGVEKAEWGLVEVAGQGFPFPQPEKQNPASVDGDAALRSLQNYHARMTTAEEWNGVMALDVYPYGLYNNHPDYETVVLPVWLANTGQNSDWAEVGVIDYGSTGARIYTYDVDQNPQWQYHNWINRSNHYGLHPWGWTDMVRRVRQVTPGSGRLEPVFRS